MIAGATDSECSSHRPAGVSAALPLAAALCISLAAGVEAPEPAAGRRVAPMTIAATASPAGLVLSDPRLVDDLTEEEDAASGRRGPTRARSIVSFVFTVERAARDQNDAEASIEIETAAGSRTSFTSKISRLKTGASVEIAAPLPITRGMEGPSKAALTVRGRKGDVLFTGSYGFGYPRYASSGGLKRVSSSAVIRDDFDANTIDQDLWRVWLSNPAEAAVEQKDGRLWVRVSGRSGYNGLTSNTETGTRDVVLACRAGIESTGEIGRASCRERVYVLV